jgi:hypothetical protein
MLLELRASGFWVSDVESQSNPLRHLVKCGLAAQRTEWTQRDLTSKGTPEIDIGFVIVFIADQVWNSSWSVKSDVRHKDQLHLWSDVLIHIWVNHFCWKIRACVCVKVFYELLEWGLVQIGRLGSSDTAWVCMRTLAGCINVSLVLSL